MRWTMTRVFPEPGPATIRSGPRVACTASRCAGFSPSSAGNSPPGGTNTWARAATRPRGLYHRAGPAPRRGSARAAVPRGPQPRPALGDGLALVGPKPRDGILGERGVEHTVQVRRLLHQPTV